MSGPDTASLTTRERLVVTAMHLFWEKGYAATGMAEILERAQDQHYHAGCRSSQTFGRTSTPHGGTL